MARSWSDTPLHFGKMRPVASTSLLCTPIGLWHAVAHVIETSRYKPDGRGLDYRRCRWYFSLMLSLCPPSVPGIFPGGKGGRCMELTTLPHSCVGSMEIWGTQPRGTLRASPGLYPYRCARKRVMIFFVFTDRIRGYSQCSIDGSLTCTNTYLNCMSLSTEFARSRLHYH